MVNHVSGEAYRLAPEYSRNLRRFWRWMAVGAVMIIITEPFIILWEYLRNRINRPR